MKNQKFIMSWLTFAIIIGIVFGIEAADNSSLNLNSTKNEKRSLIVPATNLTKVECDVSEDCGDRMWCERGICVCPTMFLKANNTCKEILGLPCTSLGQCEQYMPNSVCDLTDTHQCVCKAGFGVKKNFTSIIAPKSKGKIIELSVCSAILGAECLGHEEYCNGVQNAECASSRIESHKMVSKRCQCVSGLRPDSSLARWSLLQDTNITSSAISPVSTACEDVIGSPCTSNFSDCSAFVANSHCDDTSKKCVCQPTFLHNPITRLCSNSSALNRSLQRAENQNQNKLQYFVESRCFLIYFPCAVANSICAPRPDSPYEGYCICATGYTAVGMTTCVQDVGNLPALVIPTTAPSIDSTTTASSVDNTTTVSSVVNATTAPSVDNTTLIGSTNSTTPVSVTSTTGSIETTTTATTVGSTVEVPSKENSTTSPVSLSCGLPGNSKSDSFGLSKQFASPAATGCKMNETRVVDNKIVGGQDALPNEICWQAGVLSYMENMQSYEYCGGSILNPNYVLTAMHCVTMNEDAKQVTPIERIFVSVGASDFPTAPQAGAYCGKFIKVRRVIVHPDAEFVVNGGDFLGISNDLALIELDESLDFSQDCVCAICLFDQRPQPGEDCIVSGYGCRDAACQSPPPHSLAWLKVPIIAKDSDRCQHGDARLSTDGIVCIGSTEQQDACQGDSGGPLFCYDNKRGRYYLSGATSYGYGGIGKSCAAGQLARYTDIANYLPWIRANIQDTSTV